VARVGERSSRLGSEPRTAVRRGCFGNTGLVRMTPNGANRYARGREADDRGGSLLLRFLRWSKIWRMTLCSVMKETTRILPPVFANQRVGFEHPTNQVSPSPTKSLPLGGARGFLVVFSEG